MLVGATLLLLELLLDTEAFEGVGFSKMAARALTVGSARLIAHIVTTCATLMVFGAW